MPILPANFSEKTKDSCQKFNFYFPDIFIEITSLGSNLSIKPVQGIVNIWEEKFNIFFYKNQCFVKQLFSLTNQKRTAIYPEKLMHPTLKVSFS